MMVLIRLAEPRDCVSYLKSLLFSRPSVNVGDFCVLARMDRTSNIRAFQASLPLLDQTLLEYIGLPVPARAHWQDILVAMLLHLRIAKLVNAIADAALVNGPISCLNMSEEVLQNTK